MTAEERAIHSKLKSRRWRLNNLYWIEDELGVKRKFRLNWAQEAFLAALHWLNVILKARQLGMSTFMAIYILDACIFGSNKTCGIVDKTDTDATKKLAKIKFAYDNLDCPDADPGGGSSTAAVGAGLKESVRLVGSNDHELEFSNDSKVWAGSGLRGGTLQILHISELGYIAAFFPKKAEEIRSGALNTVHAGAIVVIESTHEGGKTGLNYEMIVTAQESPADLSPLDWRFHFFPWWRDPKYSLPNPRPIADAKLVEYFSELQAKHGILLTPGQQAWYAGKVRTQKEAMRKEFPSTAEEAVNAVVKGAIYGEEISALRAKGQIADFELVPGMPIYCAWDLGMSDFTDLWMIQPVSMKHRAFDCYENNGLGLAHYADYVRAWEADHGVKIALHLLPHDAGHKEFGTGLSVVQQLHGMGIKNVALVPRTPDIWIGINKLRQMLPNFAFHLTNTGRDRVKEGRRFPSGIGGLEAYHTHDTSTAVIIKEMPVHDDNSHRADALRTYAEGYEAGMVSSQGFGGETSGSRKVKVITRASGPVDDWDDDDFKRIRVKR